MLGCCPICLERLVASLKPVVMPCGHLYCLECATYIFYQGDNPQACSVCRKKFNGEDIIKLYLNSEGSSQSSALLQARPEHDRESETRGQGLVKACEEAFMDLEEGGDDTSLATALHETELFMKDMSDIDYHAGIQNVLKDLRTVLSNIHRTLQRKAQAQAQIKIHNPTPSATRELNLLRAKMDHDIQELYRENLLAEVAGARAQQEHERREEELQTRLQDCRRALEITRRNLEGAQHKVINLESELQKSRKGELRYKKKYYALKQEVKSAKKSARGSGHPDEDDSLIVV